MRVNHTTLRRNLSSILKRGLLCSKAQQGRKAVWFHPAKLTAWAFLHVARRHQALPSSVVTLEVEIDAKQLKRHKGGVWYSLSDIAPAQIRGVVTYDRVSRRI